MNYFTTSFANAIAGVHRPASATRENVGNFNLRCVVIKFAKKKVATSRAGKISNKQRTKIKRLACQPVKAWKRFIRRRQVLKQTRIILRHRLRHKTVALVPLKTKTPAAQLLVHAKQNSDGDRIPDLQTIEQARAFARGSNDIKFVLFKVKFHKESENALNERSKVLVQLKKTPDVPELHEKKARLDKMLGNYHRELNDALLSGFTNKAIHLLKHHNMNEATKNSLIKLLNGKDEFANLSLDEFTEELAQFQRQITVARAKKAISPAAAAA